MYMYILYSHLVIYYLEIRISTDIMQAMKIDRNKSHVSDNG